MMGAKRLVPRAAFLVGICALLTLPKLILIDFMNRALWGGFGWGAVTLMLQDVLCALLVYGALRIVLQRPSMWRIAACFAGTGMLLGFLLIDMRTRELWLKPITLDLVRYYAANASDLSSGNDIFFKNHAGFGTNFRRLLVLSGGLFVTCWAGYVLSLKWRKSPSDDGVAGPMSRRFGAVLVSVIVLALIASAVAPRRMYRSDENVLVAWAVAPLRPRPADHRADAKAFAQRPVPLSRRFHGARPISTDTPAFQNVIIVVLESFRFEGLGVGSHQPSIAPNLQRLASEGLAARCYTSLPHSSKAQFSILTGRYPFPGVEMREAMEAHQPSLLWALDADRRARTVCFSVQNLTFENMGGMLRACGVQNIWGPDELKSAATRSAGPLSSFGGDDALLLDKPRQVMADLERPFAAVYLTLSSHYPYSYPGKHTGTSTREDYERSVSYTDSVVGQLLRQWKSSGLLDNTLVVFVGDHGESFGEHGTFVHNNSMHEEEVAIPLIFWSADGALKEPSILTARQIDIAPTIADLMGVNKSDQPVQGRSLLRPEGPAPAYISSFFAEVSQALVVDQHKYIYFPSEGRLLLYDRGTDPLEMNAIDVSAGERERIIGQFEAFNACQRQLFEDPANAVTSSDSNGGPGELLHDVPPAT